MSLNPIRQAANAVANAATTVTGTLKAGKDYAVTKINQNPAKTAVVSGASGLALAGASAALITLVSATAGIALAAVAALAIAFAAYNAVKAHLANKKIQQAPVAAAAPAVPAALTAQQRLANELKQVVASREAKRNFSAVLAQLSPAVVAAPVAAVAAADADLSAQFSAAQAEAFEIPEDAEEAPAQLSWLESLAATVLFARA